MEYDEIEDPLPFDLNAPVIEIKDEDYALWYRDIAEEMKKYQGKTVRFKGQVVIHDKLPKDCFIVGRQIMTCCVEDISFSALACNYAKASELKKREWVTVTAQVNVRFHRVYGKKGPVLNVLALEHSEPPRSKSRLFIDLAAPAKKKEAFPARESLFTKRRVCMKTMWKKFLAAALALVLIAALAACGAPASNEDEEAQNTPVQPAQESPAPEESPELEEVPAAEEEEIAWPDALPLTFVFSSGAGGWFTELELQPDGSFTGSYHDSEMGEFAEDYPNGTVYVCEFSGRFEALSHPDENTWF